MTARAARWLAALAALLCAAGPAHAQDTSPTEVPVQAVAEGDSAMIVFLWPSPVAFDARVAGRSLQVRFDRPIVPRLSEVRTKLGAFVESVGVEDDGRMLIMTLTGAFSLSSARQDNAVVLTLTRAEGGRQAGEELPVVGVRVGEHEAFGRVVFDWAREVGYRIERDGDTAVLRFELPARLDLADARSNLPPEIVSIEEIVGGPPAVAIGLAAGAHLRDYRVGLKVVVDVFPATPPETAEVELEEAPDRSDTAVVVVEPVEPEPPAPAAAEAAAPPADAPAREPETSAAVAAEEPPSAPLPLVARAPRHDTSPWQALRSLDKPDAPAAAQAAPEAVAEPAAEPAPEPVAEPAVAEPDPVLPADPEAPGLAAAMRAEAPAPGAGDVTLLVGFDVLPDGLDLVFDWPADVRAAVFARAGHLWVVFDAPAEFNFRLLREDLPAIAKAEQVPLVGAAAARFVLSGRFRAQVMRDGDRWRVRLGPKGGAAAALGVTVEGDSEVGARLIVAEPAPGNAFVLTDPEVGDQLTVVPVAGAGRGITPPRHLVDLELLETVQGVVVRPISDTVAVRSLRDVIEITDLAGLELASLAEDVEAGEERGPLTPPPVIEPPPLARPPSPDLDPTAMMLAADDQPVFDFAAWRNASGAGFLAAKHRLNDRLAALDAEGRGAGRLALARFHLADAQAAEALGWLALALAEDPRLEQDRNVRALRGAANLLQGRLTEARSDLFDPAFDLSREMRLWRAAWLAEQGDMASANQAFLAGGEVPAGYPRRVASRFRLLAAEAAARAGDVDRAHLMLDALQRDPRERAAVDRISYVRGLAYANAGDTERALDMLARAGSGSDREVRARAERDRVELMLAKGLVTREQAVEALDGLRFAWRGDALELDLLQRIAELQIGVGNYAAGLATYRQAIAVFPDSPDVRMIASVMNDTFKRLFLGGLGDELSPLEALAIYYDFRELTPVGAVGDQMIYRLADRLIEVDLLEQAATVLQHQVDHRLRGPDLARVGARLASIYLLDKKPALAVRALKASEATAMADELARQRRELLVRALTGTGDYDRALDLLYGDPGFEADRMRAEIYWRKQDWLSTATVTARMLARRPPEDTLTASESDDLMRMAVALVLTNNRGALIELKDRYGEALAHSGRAEAFKAIASYADAAPVSPRAISAAVAEIDSYEAFLASLRKEVSENELAPAE